MSTLSKRNNAFKQVIIALLEHKAMSQRQLSIELDTSPSNLNQRINAGSMRPDMIMKINKIFNTDVLQLVIRLQNGEKSDVIIKSLSNNNSVTKESIQLLKNTIAEQEKTIAYHQEQVGTLITTIGSFIQKPE
jgi:lambda repressor-like predicted transcriptional regulator